MAAFTKVKANSAGELLQHFELSDESEQYGVLEEAPAKVIHQLVEAEHYHDAITMLAHALPKREAVWWACLAAKKTMDETEPNVAALQAAETWVREPTEENRKVAKKLGERPRQKSAPIWVATAASWCTGSMVEEEDISVPPPDFLYAHAVAASITMAAVAAGPEAMAESYHYFIRQGFDLAGGGTGQLDS